MAVLAVVNRKGGSGKSTLATHLAAHLARSGERILLGDVDRQLSTQVWLKRRAESQHSRVVGWPVDPKAMVRPPAGASHVVLDTPGGLRGFDLARVVMYADAILLPLCNSVFDRESAAECVAELQALPRVAGGRCRLAAVGMRVDSRARTIETMNAWAQGIGITFLGTLRYSPHYVECVEEGMTLFDLPAKDVRTDLAQWQPIIDWVTSNIEQPPPAQPQPSKAPAAPVARSAARVAPARGAAGAELAARVTRLLGALAVPQFLQRDRPL